MIVLQNLDNVKLENLVCTFASYSQNQNNIAHKIYTKKRLFLTYLFQTTNLPETPPMTVINDVPGLNIVINVPIVNGAGYAHLAVCRVKTANIAGSVRELQVPAQSVVDIEVNVHNKLKKWDIT